MTNNSTDFKQGNSETDDSQKDKSLGEKKWYIVQVASNCEKSVQKSILDKALEDGLLEKFGEILIPSYKSNMIVRGKKQEVDKRLVPGYIIINMILDTSTTSLVKSIRKVSGFLGGEKPKPITQSQVDNIIKTALEYTDDKNISPFNIGDAVQINSGPFESFNGNIKEVDLEKKKLKVYVSVFGRETLIETDIDSVKKL